MKKKTSFRADVPAVREHFVSIDLIRLCPEARKNETVAEFSSMFVNKTPVANERKL